MLAAREGNLTYTHRPTSVETFGDGKLVIIARLPPHSELGFELYITVHMARPE